MLPDLTKLEKLTGIKFRDPELLQLALTHKSYSAETGINHNNERLEFLGDSILAAVVADFLFQKYAEDDEGRLSQIKSQLVSRQNLAKWARKIKLGSYIFISKGEEASGGRLRDSLLSNAFEALIASIYMDAGFKAANNFILEFLQAQRRVIINDAKSKFQEYAQSVCRALPEYRVLSEAGPDHEKTFEIGVYIKKHLLGSGSGHSKKEAEQLAAKSALKSLKNKKSE